LHGDPAQFGERDAKPFREDLAHRLVRFATDPKPRLDETRGVPRVTVK
jgi:hypothetical protein